MINPIQAETTTSPILLQAKESTDSGTNAGKEQSDLPSSPIENTNREENETWTNDEGNNVTDDIKCT